MRMPTFRIRQFMTTVVAFVAAGILCQSACADAVESFYKGKTIAMTIGFGVGGR
jgi:hypothetical protein